MKDVIKNLLNEQLSSSQVVTEFDVTKEQIKIWRKQGLTPFIFNDEEDHIVTLEEVTQEINSKTFGMTIQRVYLLTAEHAKKAQELINQCNSVIDRLYGNIQKMKQIITGYIEKNLIQKKS